MFSNILSYGVFGIGLILLAYVLFKKTNSKSGEKINNFNTSTEKTNPKSLVGSVFFAVGIVLVLMIVLVIYYNIQDIKNYNG